MARLGRQTEATLANGRSVCVRDARPRDAGAVLQVVDAVAAEPVTTLLIAPGEATAGDWRRRIVRTRRSPDGLFLVAEVEGEIVGDLGLWPDAHPCSSHVVWFGMSVSAAHRGVGVGGALLETALSWAAAAGYRRAALGVLPGNARAIAFYERHGFVREGVRRGQYRRGDEYHDEVLMARPLTLGR